MRLKLLFALSLLFGLGVPARAQSSPYSNVIFKAQTFTATGQTGTPIQLNGLVISSTVGSSFSSGTITVTGSSLSTVTFAVQGSSDGGATYYALPISTVATPTAAPTLTVTATSTGLYQINLAGLTHVRFVTSGTFTATNVILTLTASPNASLSKVNSGGSVTASAMQAAMSTQTGCTTAGNAWNPATNTCTPATGDGATLPFPGIAYASSGTAGRVATGDTDYQSVISTPKQSGISSPLTTIANNVFDQSCSGTFSDGTPFCTAGPTYVSFGEFIDDQTLACMSNPGKCSTALLLNTLQKWDSKYSNSLGYPIAISQNLATPFYCSGADSYCHYSSGDGRIMVPVTLWLYCQKVGSGNSACTSAYTSYVTHIKAAWALVPRDSSTHLYQVVPGDEYVCGTAFMEYMRNTGLVANCNVWAAIDDAYMAQLATAAGDSTNATFFTNDLALLQTGIRANLINGTTGLLKTATIQNASNDDLVSSSLAVACDLMPSTFAPCGILTSSQKTAIETYLDTNYSTIVNSAGFILETPKAGGWTTIGYIPASGGPPYTVPPYSGTQYQGGFWDFHSSWFDAALGVVDPTKVRTNLQTLLSGPDLGCEYFNQGSSTCNGTTPNLESPQGPMAAYNALPTAFPWVAGVPCMNQYNAPFPATLCTVNMALTFNKIATFNGGSLANTEVMDLINGNAAGASAINLVGVSHYSTVGYANPSYTLFPFLADKTYLASQSNDICLAASAIIRGVCDLNISTSTGDTTVSGLVDSGLTPGNCVQAATGGKLSTTATPCGSGGTGSGTTITVNGGSALTSADLNSTTPAAPAQSQPVIFQQSSTSVSGYVPAVNLATSPVGYFFPAWNPGASVTTGGIVGSGNQILVTQFVLPYAITVRQLTFQVTTAVSSSVVAIGIYDSGGNKMVAADNVSSATTGVKTTAVGPVTLTPGVYYLAQASSSASVGCSIITTDSNVDTFINHNSIKRQGNATNTLSSGVLPSTLGTVGAALVHPLMTLIEP